MSQINRLIHEMLRLIGLEIVDVLPPPDRSTMRQMELFDRQAMYIRRLDREG